MNSQIYKQTVSKLEEKITELKTELTTVKSQLETKLRTFESEKAHLEAREQTLRETVDNLKQDKDKIETDLKQRLSQEKKESMNLVEEYKQIAYNAEESSKALQRQVMSSESEFDKQKALLNQKVDHLEQNLESMRTKEKEYISDLKS